MMVNTNYMAWLTNIATDGHAHDCIYKKLFTQLMTTPFRWSSGIPLDENRAYDGKSLRKKFCKRTASTSAIMRKPYLINVENIGECPALWERILPLEMSEEDIPASVFEVMVALAMRIEADIMHDTEYGDRTSLWFGHMVAALGLTECNDANYDEAYVSSVLERFMDRQYEPCGRGGLFTTSDPTLLMPTIEIWQQAQIWLLHDVINK